MQIIMGLIGMVVLLAIAVLLSSNRKAINLRTVLGAWIIQVGIGALILYVPGRAHRAAGYVERRCQRHCLRQ